VTCHGSNRNSLNTPSSICSLHMHAKRGREPPGGPTRLARR
jgi:hypothetical protein